MDFMPVCKIPNLVSIFFVKYQVYNSVTDDIFGSVILNNVLVDKTAEKYFLPLNLF